MIASPRTLPSWILAIAGGSAVKPTGVWPADDRRDRRRRARERHHREIEPEVQLEQFAGEMRRRADAGLRIAELAGDALTSCTSSLTDFAGTED